MEDKLLSVMKKYLPYIIFVLLAYAVGYVSMNMQKDALVEWYPYLEKSSLNPPGIVFAIVWPVLYLLMGVSAGVLWNVHSIYSWFVILIFFVQLGLNLMWSFCFFYMRSPSMGLVVLSLLIIAVVLYVVMAYLVKRSAGLLNVPYVLWLVFALYLNAYVVLNN